MQWSVLVSSATCLKKLLRRFLTQSLTTGQARERCDPVVLLRSEFSILRGDA